MKDHRSWRYLANTLKIFKALVDDTVCLVTLWAVAAPLSSGKFYKDYEEKAKANAVSVIANYS